jgi:hypothetical protein
MVTVTRQRHHAGLLLNIHAIGQTIAKIRQTPVAAIEPDNFNRVTKVKGRMTMSSSSGYEVSFHLIMQNRKSVSNIDPQTAAMIAAMIAALNGENPGAVRGSDVMAYLVV